MWRKREPTRVSRKWFSESAWDTSDEAGRRVGGPNRAECNSMFSICTSGTSTPLKTLGNDKTIYSGRALGGLPVENTLKMYWKHSKMIEIKQVTGRTREIYPSRPHRVRALRSNESFRILLPDETPSARRIDRTLWLETRRIPKYCNCEMIDRSRIPADKSASSAGKFWVSTSWKFLPSPSEKKKKRKRTSYILSYGNGRLEYSV